MAVLTFPLVVVAVMAVMAVADVRQPTVPLVVAVAVWGQPTRHRTHKASAQTPIFQMPWPSLSLTAIGNRM
jgi:Na+/H+ antiporter NhaA